MVRPVYAGPAGGTVRPVDEWLGIAQSNLSVGARELACRVTLGGLSFKKASVALGRLAQIRVGHEWLRRIAEAEGRGVKEAVRTGVVGPGWEASDCRVTPKGPTRVIVGCDGVMVPVVTAAEKRKRRQRRPRRRKVRRRRVKAKGVSRLKTGRRRRHRGSDTGYKEFKIVAFYDAGSEHQYALGTAGNCQALGRLMRREAAKVKLPEADEKVAVSDGAEWIRRQLQTRLPMLDARILDYFHLMQQVGAAAMVCFGEGSKEASAWCTAASEAVCEEGAAGLLVRIHETRRSVRAKTKREALKQLEQYVAKRAEMLDYPAFREQGFDIGSGPTEAFCKTLTMRLKGSGMRWDKPNAEAIMALAAIENSNLWEAYWNQERRHAA